MGIGRRNAEIPQMTSLLFSLLILKHVHIALPTYSIVGDGVPVLHPRVIFDCFLVVARRTCHEFGAEKRREGEKKKRCIAGGARSLFFF